MKPSIRRTLLLWYALILTLVLGVFGGLVYGYHRRAVEERMDGEIVAYASALAGSVEWEEHEGFDLELTREYLRRTPELTARRLGFRIEGARGEVLLEHAAAGTPGPPLSSVVETGPRGSRVWVSRYTDDVDRELAGFLTAVVLIGIATLAVSLLGGFFLTGRLLSPIRRMTQAAEGVSERDLSRRLDVGNTETELGRLATTLNDTYDRLEGAFERQARFTADASHELRTPLSVVVSNAELALRRDRTDEEYRDALAKCLRAGRRMSGVVDGLLVLARADAGEMETEFEPVDLAPVVREAVDFLAPMADDRSVEVTVESEPVIVSGDAGRLRDVAGNLVSNAIRYNREGGCVTVNLASADGEAVLTVADTGPGIPADARERVFERFYRVDPARSREVGGSGLGLAISKWIVGAHGGRIDLESEESVGTTVTVRIPMRD